MKYVFTKLYSMFRTIVLNVGYIVPKRLVQLYAILSTFYIRRSFSLYLSFLLPLHCAVSGNISRGGAMWQLMNVALRGFPFSVFTLSSLLPTTLSLTRNYHLSVSLRAPVLDVADTVYAFANATQGDTVAIDEPRIEMGGAGTVVLVTIVTE